MKNTLFILVMIIGFASCSKKEEVALTPTVVTISTYKFISNFKVDTFKNGLIGNAPTDSFVSFVHGDTTGIVYAGTTLYIFAIGGDDSTKSIHMAYISPVAFDTAAKWSKAWVMASKHYNTGDAKTINQRQNINISTRAPHFSTTGDAMYYGK